VRATWTRRTPGPHARLDECHRAIVDTGINPRPAGVRGTAWWPVTTSSNDDPILDDNTGHGTAVAAIIGANAMNSNAIAGID